MHTPINRRTALKASGIAIALPLLESMSPAIGRDAESPQRMVLICNTLGLHPPSLFPETPGRDYESTEYLDLLKDHRDRLTLFSGLSHPDQNGKQPHVNFNLHIDFINFELYRTTQQFRCKISLF